MRVIIGLGTALALLMVAEGARAATFTACFQMPYQGYFVDDGMGEDHHGAWYKPRGMQYEIRTSGGSFVVGGNLSSQGCASFDDGRPAGTAYKILYTSKVTFSNGDYVTVYGPSVANDVFSDPITRTNTDTFVKTSAAEASYQFPIASGAPNPQPEHKVATLFSFAAVSRGWRSKPKTRVYLGVDGSGGSSCVSNDVHSTTEAGTCCPDNDLNLCKIEVGSFFAVRKFVLMHEYGHTVAHRITGSGSWDNGSNDCSLGGGGYTFTSHEYMGCAANEGFADFVSTSVFNDPDWNALYYRGEEFWMTDDWHQCDNDYYGGDAGECVAQGEGTRQGWMRTWWRYAQSVSRADLEDQLACAYPWGRHDLVDNIRSATCMSGPHRLIFDNALWLVGP